MRRFQLPSPAMTVACTALFVALGGTSIAAVNYARNAGAVDGKSAVSAGASRASAAGRLVATQRSGDERGTISSKVLDPDLMRGNAFNFHDLLQTEDNQVGAPRDLIVVEDLGRVGIQCSDVNPDAGVENPAVTIAFTPTAGAVNYARQTGQPPNRERPGRPFIASVPQGATEPFVLRVSDTFDLRLERSGRTVQILGVVRQDGEGSPTAACLVYGTAFVVR